MRKADTSSPSREKALSLVSIVELGGEDMAGGWEIFDSLCVVWD